MRNFTPRNWSVYALAALLAFAGIAVAYTAVNGNSEINTTNTGEKNMSMTQTKSPVLHANDSNFRNIVLDSNVPVLVDFYADWCGPCKRITPILEELAVECPSVKIVKINVEDSPNLAMEYGVNAIPSLKLFKNGRISGEHVGLASKSDLRAMLDR
jgi:thioredoxin 1